MSDIGMGQVQTPATRLQSALLSLQGAIDEVGELTERMNDIRYRLCGSPSDTTKPPEEKKLNRAGMLGTLDDEIERLNNIVKALASVTAAISKEV